MTAGLDGRRTAPGRRAAGTTPRWPNVIIPGAGKSGTTFLASLLGQLPSFHLPATKEPALFSDHPRWGPWPPTDRYRAQWLADHDGEPHLIDASTIYLWDDPAAERIATEAGDAHLVFCLRDPVDRLYSNYWQDRKAGIDHPPFEAFVAARCHRFENMLKASSYHLDLPRFERRFPAERITYVDYRRLVGSPLTTAATVVERITGHPVERADLERSLDTSPRNTSGRPRNMALARALRHPEAIDVARRLVPPVASTGMKRILTRLRAANETSVGYEPMAERVRDELADALRPAAEVMADRLSSTSSGE